MKSLYVPKNMEKRRSSNVCSIKFYKFVVGKKEIEIEIK